ncbi:peptidase C14, partial [Rhizoctonia solani AG-3 Rhs1AP]
MSFRDKFRKFRSDTKSRIFQTNDENNNAHNSPPQTSSTTPDRWIHLRALLKTLERATRSLPPLKAVVTEFVECIDNHENVWHGRKEYDILCHELEGLFQALQHHCNQDISPTITTTVEALCESIRNEISDIRKIQAKGKVREYLEAERDADAVLVRYRRIQSHLQRLSVATQLNADISVWRIVDEIATDNRLKYLSPSLSACYNSAQAVELKRGPCTEGTRVDLLGQILGWIESSDSGSIYWMNGMAGTGKTTIAYSLCEELDTSYKLAASFFCSRLLPECRDVNLIIPSIAFQLARSSRPFRFVLSRVLERDPGVHTRLPHLQFDSLVSQPLLEVRSTLPENLVVVIDALDECENKESTSRILEILLTKSTNLPLKFIVSSRPEPEIRDEMLKQSNQAKSRVVLHELDRLTVQADIETYLRSALIQVQPTEDQIATLVERAGILFIYAATVVRYIAHDRFRRNPRARLVNVLSSSSASENKHREIDELYTIILRAALDDPNLDKSEREDIVQVLNSVICAQEPLTVDALSKLLKINNTDREYAPSVQYL